MRASWLIGCSLVSMVAACTGGGDPDDKAPGDWVPGKGDGAFDLVEVGPAPIGGKARVALEGRVPAYRVESFGGTTLDIDLGGGGSDAYVIVEGPLDAAGDRIAIGGGAVVAEDDDSGPGRDAPVTVELPRAGIYRILAGTYESLGRGGRAAGSLDLAVTCTASCDRGSIDQKTFVRALRAQPAFAEYAKAELAALVHDPAAAAALGAQLEAILADPDLTGIERFPTFTLAQIAAIRPALGGLPTEPPAPDRVVTGELTALLGGCTPDRALPAQLDPRLPGVRYGHFPDATLSPCQFAHGDPLAQVLSSLAADNGSAVTFKGATIETPKALFAALLDSGHAIEVNNERTYANFLSAIVGDRDLVWPVWLDTGIALATGDSLTIPMGHSHHAWRISGPNVNTRVMFYLGVSGTGFFGQTSTRPAWTGLVASSTATDRASVLATVDTAATYLRRNRVERTTVAAGMPADGYGYVGVCNDSNATIELATKGTVSTFPLLRAKALDAAADLGDGLDATVKALPNDAEGLTSRTDALRRVLAMQPGTDGFDATLAAQLAAARAE